MLQARIIGGAISVSLLGMGCSGLAGDAEVGPVEEQEPVERIARSRQRLVSYSLNSTDLDPNQIGEVYTGVYAPGTEGPPGPVGFCYLIALRGAFVGDLDFARIELTNVGEYVLRVRRGDGSPGATVECLQLNEWHMQNPNVNEGSFVFANHEATAEQVEYNGYVTGYSPNDFLARDIATLSGVSGRLRKAGDAVSMVKTQRGRLAPSVTTTVLGPNNECEDADIDGCWLRGNGRSFHSAEVFPYFSPQDQWTFAAANVLSVPLNYEGVYFCYLTAVENMSEPTSSVKITGGHQDTVLYLETASNNPPYANGAASCVSLIDLQQ